MDDFAQFWMEGGAAMYLVLLLAVVAEVAAAVAAMVRNNVLALVALALSTLPLTVGALGRSYNVMTVERAVTMVNPNDKAIILEQGMKEAARPVQLGGVCTALTLPTALAAYLVSRRRKSDVASISEPPR